MVTDRSVTPVLLSRRQLMLGAPALVLAGCAAPEPEDDGLGVLDPNVPPQVAARYGAIDDGEFLINAVPRDILTLRRVRVMVAYTGPEPAGTIVVDPYARFLYHVTGPERAWRYGIAVGRAGRGFAGDAVIRRKEKWPPWTPTRNMVRTEPELYAQYADGLPGGPINPLGARALYLYRGNRDTFYRIHGTNEVNSIGKATSAGCIRLFNQDILDLFERTELGTPVRVRTPAESRDLEGVLEEQPDGTLIQLEPPLIWPDGY